MLKTRKNSIICIRCPKGCKLSLVAYKNDVKIEGNDCKIGIEYGLEEIKNPMRIVSSTIKILNSKYPRLPVRTKDTVPKDKIKKIIDIIKNKTVEAPVNIGQVVVKNIADTGSDLIAERDMELV